MKTLLFISAFFFFLQSFAQSPDGCFVYSSDKPGLLIKYRCDWIKDVVIPKMTTAIADKVFANMDLTSAQIPDGVISIGVAAFHGNKLRSIVIPDSVTSIGAGAFHSNQAESITLSKNLELIPVEAFHYAGSKAQAVDLIIPDGVIEIGYKAFRYAGIRSLEEIPRSVERIYNAAFQANSKLKFMRVPTTTKFIYDYWSGYELPEDVDVIQRY